MTEEDFSQLPVSAQGEIIGVFSWRAFCTRLMEFPESLRLKIDAARLPVREFVVRAQFVDEDEYIDTSTKANWNEQDFVLIGTPKALSGVLAVSDVLARLYDFAEAFVLVYEVEMALRDLIRTALPDAEQLRQVILRLTTKSGDEAKRKIDAILRRVAPEDSGRQQWVNAIVAACAREKPIDDLEDLTFDQYRLIVVDQANWPLFEPGFFSQREIVDVDLESVRKIRNDAMHFRRAIKTPDTYQLRRLRDRLRGARERLAKLHRGGVPEEATQIRIAG
jgi:hypothetical protein